MKQAGTPDGYVFAVWASIASISGPMAAIGDFLLGSVGMTSPRAILPLTAVRVSASWPKSMILEVSKGVQPSAELITRSVFRHLAHHRGKELNLTASVQASGSVERTSAISHALAAWIGAAPIRSVVSTN